MRSNRAIIFFVRDRRREEALKPLPERYRARGYGSLNRGIAARLRPLLGDGADLVVVSGGSDRFPGASAQLAQRGSSFGERLGNAIADTFALGYEHVVAIGNDCPELAPADLAAAFARLDAGASLVAAPTHDGGAFLIGASRRGLGPEHCERMQEFIALPWQTSGLFAALAHLPGAAALPILRRDFDIWRGAQAMRALELLFGEPRATHLRIPFPPLRTAARMKALTRGFLTAPPLG